MIYKIHKKEVRYKNYRVVGIQKYKVVGKEKIPYTFHGRDGYLYMAYDLKIYNNGKLIHKDRITSYGAEPFLIDREELEEVSGISHVMILPSGPSF